MARRSRGQHPGAPPTGFLSYRWIGFSGAATPKPVVPPLHECDAGPPAAFAGDGPIVVAPALPSCYIVVSDQHSRGENMLKMTRLAMLATALVLAMPAALAPSVASAQAQPAPAATRATPPAAPAATTPSPAPAA